MKCRREAQKQTHPQSLKRLKEEELEAGRGEELPVKMLLQLVEAIFFKSTRSP